MLKTSIVEYHNNGWIVVLLITVCMSGGFVLGWVWRDGIQEGTLREIYEHNLEAANTSDGVVYSRRRQEVPASGRRQ